MPQRSEPFALKKNYPKGVGLVKNLVKEKVPSFTKFHRMTAPWSHRPRPTGTVWFPPPLGGPELDEPPHALSPGPFQDPGPCGQVLHGQPL